MSCKSPRSAALSLLALIGAAAAQAEPSPAASDACVVAVARDFNGIVPLLAERQRFQRAERDELAALAARLNALRGRITEALEAPAPSASAAADRCAVLARDLAVERDALRELSPTPVPIANPVETTAPLPPAARATGRAAESLAAAPRAPVKRATAPAAPPSSPTPRVDPQLDACKAQLRQTHAEAEQLLQMAARSGRIMPQQLPEMLRAQSRLADLTDAVRRSYETVGECEQLSHVLAQEVGRVRALAR